MRISSLARRAAASAGIGALLATLVVAAPTSVPQASAQADCAANSESTLNGCISAYNLAGAGTVTTISVQNFILLSDTATTISNTTTAKLFIEGNGHRVLTASSFAGPNLLVQEAGDLELADLTLTDAPATGTALVVESGRATIIGSTFTDNGFGLVAFSAIPIVVINSTIHANASYGMLVTSGEPAQVVSSTITDNGDYGIVTIGGSITITDSLVAGNNGNSSGDQCSGANIGDGGGNVVEDSSCAPIVATPSVAGTYRPSLSGGGCVEPCTRTIELYDESPAIDAAGDCDVATDQRGVPRTVGKCDAGAYEAGDCVNPYHVDTEADLKFAMSCYNRAGDGEAHVIEFDGDIELSDDVTSINNPTSATLKIAGNGRTLSRVAAPGLNLLLWQEGGDLDLADLTMERNPAGPSSIGLYASGGATTVEGSTFGGLEIGLRLSSTTPTVVRNTTFYGNQTGIRRVGGMVDVFSSTFVENDFAAIDLASGRATFTDSLLSGDRDECVGFGVITDGGGNVVPSLSCSPIAPTPGVAGTYASPAANGCIAPCTHTVALLPGSPAIDAAADCTVATDQRNAPRTIGKCDAGAFELGDCESFFEIGSESEFNFAIGCYNLAGEGETVEVELVADIETSGPATTVDNPTSAALLVDGNGHTVAAAASFVGDALIKQAAGNLELVDLIVAHAPEAGLLVLGGNTIVTASTFHDNGQGLSTSSPTAPVIHNSTFHDNGHGLSTSSPTAPLIHNSTFHNNTSDAIAVTLGRSVEVVSSTIVDNGGYGILGFLDSSLTITDSLIAGNNGEGAGIECSGDPVIDGGGNVVDDSTCGSIAATPAIGGTYNSALATNGCVSPCPPTVALLAGSPAIDAAGACDASTDQRGVIRTVGKCDAGAFELGDFDADDDGFEGALGSGDDCDDGDDSVFPGAVEVADDGVDQDCDGSDLSTAVCNGLPVTINMNLNGGVGVGTAGDDVILGTSGADVIEGAGGDDTICGEGGDDQLAGSDGNDTIFGGPGNDELLGGNGNDSLFGEDGRDIARGGPDVDLVEGGAGNDRLLGGIGNDTINGGEGDDYLGGFGGADTINGGPGNETIYGGFGADIIDGGPGSDTIRGLIGNDTIRGGSGNDKLDGDRGNDRIDGGPGNDTIGGGNANDVLNGDGGDDTISGGKADDTLSGGAGTADVCIGNLQTTADTADATCETTFGIP